jgi:hypothetical protein
MTGPAWWPAYALAAFAVTLAFGAWIGYGLSADRAEARLLARRRDASAVSALLTPPQDPATVPLRHVPAQPPAPGRPAPGRAGPWHHPPTAPTAPMPVPQARGRDVSGEFAAIARARARDRTDGVYRRPGPGPGPAGREPGRHRTAPEASHGRP